MNILRLSIGLLFVSIITGCETLNPPRPGSDAAYSPTYPASPGPKNVRYANGSIYNPETALPLFETPRARHPGDIITVVLVEKTDAQKRAISRQRKNDKTEVANTTFAGRPISLGGGYNLDFDLDAKRKFEGEGQSIQNNRLDGRISMTVSKVLPNGTMMIQGEKWIRINQGQEFIRLSGVIRPQDIRPDNTVTSDRVANARMSYGGVGQVNNTNVQGWLSKIIWSGFFPI